MALERTVKNRTGYMSGENLKFAIVSYGMFL